MRHALMKFPPIGVRALGVALMIGGLVLPQSAGAQGGLLDFLTGGERPRRAAPSEPAPSEPANAAPANEAKKKKPATGLRQRGSRKLPESSEPDRRAGQQRAKCKSKVQNVSHGASCRLPAARGQWV